MNTSAPSDTDTETKILEAAHRVFTRRGVAAARTQEIADEAGVNKALLHYYYRTKEKLSDAVFLGAAREMLPQMMGALASDLPLRQKLQAAIDVEMATLDAHPFLPGYIICELRSQPERLKSLLSEAVPMESARRALFSSIQAQLDEQADLGHLRPTRSETFVVALLSLLIFPHAASQMLEVAAGLDDGAQAQLADWRRTELADFLLRGFSA